MPTIINADTSDGLKFTSDTSGEINLQSGGADIATVSSTGIAMASGKTLPAASLTGTLPAGTNVISAGTSVASTSGTSIDFTGIPSWVKRISIMLDTVSTNGSSTYQVQIGDSGGVETSGYIGVAGTITYVSNTTRGKANSSGFLIYGTSTASSYTHTGIIQLSNLTGNTWVVNGAFYDTGIACSIPSGLKTLTSTLDRVRITTENGTDTFDAGTINIMYE